MFSPHYDVLLCFYNRTDNGKMLSYYLFYIEKIYSYSKSLFAPKHLENRRVEQIQSFEVHKLDTF